MSILRHLAKSDHALKGEIEADEAYFGGRRKRNRGCGAKNKTIMFGILERGGKVSASINVSADTPDGSDRQEGKTWQYSIHRQIVWI